MVEKWKTIYSRYIFLAEYLFIIYAAECTFGGSGRWLSIAGVSIRMLLFSLCFFVSLPAVIIDFRTIIKCRSISSELLFFVVLFCSLIIGAAYGNSPTFIRADFTSFLALLLIPGMIAVMGNELKLERLLTTVYWSAFFVALCTVLLHFALRWMSDAAINAVNDWINEKSLGGLALLVTGINRIYLRAQIFMQFSLMTGIWKIWNHKGKYKVLYLISEGILLFSMILSYTRGFWLGFTVSAFLALILLHRAWIRLMTVATAAISCVLIMMGISWLTYGTPATAIEIINRFDPDLIVLTVNEAETQEFPSDASSNTIAE